MLCWEISYCIPYVYYHSTIWRFLQLKNLMEYKPMFTFYSQVKGFDLSIFFSLTNIFSHGFIRMEMGALE